MTVSTLGKDKLGQTVGDIRLSEESHTIRLLADTNKSLSISTSFDVIVVTCDEPIFISKTSISLPTSHEFTRLDYEQVPAGKFYYTSKDVETIHVRSRTECDVTIAYYLFGER